MHRVLNIDSHIDSDYFKINMTIVSNGDELVVIFTYINKPLCKISFCTINNRVIYFNNNYEHDHFVIPDMTRLDDSIKILSLNDENQNIQETTNIYNIIASKLNMTVDNTMSLMVFINNVNRDLFNERINP